MTDTQTTARPMSAAQWAMLIGLSVLWGGSFFFNQIAVAELPVFSVVTGRVVIAALVLVAILRIRGLRLPRDRRVWAAFLVMGLLNNAIPFSLIVAGQRDVGSGVAAILNASTPLFGVLCAHVLTRDERLTPARLAGVLIGLAGVAVMIGMDAVHALGANLLAQGMCLAAALSYALAGIYGRRFRHMGIGPMTTAAGQVVASSCLMLPVALLLDRPWQVPPPDPGAVLAVVALAVLSTALAYIVYFRLLASAGATNLLLVTLLVPVSAILLATGILGEVLAPRHLLGMALIGAGLAAIDGRLAARLARPGSG